MKYYVSITETLSRVVGVDADSEQDAISRVKEAYNKWEIMLDSETLVGYAIDIADDQEYYQDLELQTV